MVSERKLEVGRTGLGNEFIEDNPYNNHRFHELQFSPIFPYEKELNLTPSSKVEMLEKVIDYLLKRNIHVTFTDRLMIDNKIWEKKQGENFKYLPIAELVGNNICINPRSIDFLSIFFSLGHIYGHLVQRMEAEKYKHITDFLDYPKPLDLTLILSDYREKYGGDYKVNFLEFEKEAFSYAKFTFLDAGIEFSPILDHAMNVYIETDFQELWRWVASEPLKSGEKFMDVFTEKFEKTKGKFAPIEPKEVRISVVPATDGILEIVRDEFGSYFE